MQMSVWSTVSPDTRIACIHFPYLSDQSQGSAYQLSADADQDRQGEGKQRPFRVALVQTITSTSRVLESSQANRFSLSWQDAQCATSWSHDSDLLQDGGCQGSPQQACSHKRNNYQSGGSLSHRPGWSELFYGKHRPTWWRNVESG